MIYGVACAPKPDVPQHLPEMLCSALLVRRGPCSGLGNEYRLALLPHSLYRHQIFGFFGPMGGQLDMLSPTPRPISYLVSRLAFDQMVKKKKSEGFLSVDLAQLLDVQRAQSSSQPWHKGWSLAFAYGHQLTRLNDYVATLAHIMSPQQRALLRSNETAAAMVQSKAAELPTTGQFAALGPGPEAIAYLQASGLNKLGFVWAFEAGRFHTKSHTH